MESGFTFRAYGVTVAIACEPAGATERLREMLPPGSVLVEPARPTATFRLTVEPAQSPSGHPHFVISRGREALGRTGDLDSAIEALEGELRLWVAARARRRIFVHAGVVGWSGKAIVIPGRSFFGKSTLVRALLARGASYLSDEYAVLDQRGRVHPYPRPIAIRDGEAVARQFDVTTWGAQVQGTPLPVGTVIVTRYQQGAQFQPRPLTHGQVVLEVLNHTIPVRRSPARAMSTVATALAAAAGFASDRGDADACAEAVLARLAT